MRIFRRILPMPGPFFNRGYCDDAEGHTEAAEGYYRKAIAADPKQFEARLALGLLLAQAGSVDAKT